MILLAPRQHFWENRQADLLRRLEIDDEFELLGPFLVINQNIFSLLIEPK